MGNGGISPYSGGSGGAGGSSGSGGRSPLEAMYTIIAVAIVLVFALIVELWKYPWQVWAFFAGIGILGYLCMRFWPHVVKTAQGRALIYTVPDHDGGATHDAEAAHSAAGRGVPVGYESGAPLGRAGVRISPRVRCGL